MKRSLLYPILRAAAETTVTPPTPAVPTAEEIQAQTKIAMEAMGFGAAVCPPKAVEEVPETPPETPAAPAAEAPPVTAPVTPPVEKTDEEKRTDLINQTAKATAEAVAERMKPATPPAAPTAPDAPAPAAPEMGKEDKADYDVLMRLAEGDPAYAEKAEQFAAFVKASYAYQDDWTNKNPGKDFNADDEEHTAWYEANQKITPEDVKSAREELRITEIAERRVAPVLAKISKQEAEEVIKQSIPVVAGIVTSNIAKLVELVDPTLAAHLKDGSGVVKIDEEAHQRVIAADPIAAREIGMVVDIVRPMILELEKAAIPALNHRLDPANNQLHAQIDRFRKEVEAEVLAKPAAEQVVDGKKFVTVEDYNAERARIARNTPVKQRDAEVAKYSDSVRLASIDEIEAKIVEHYSGQAKKIIGEINSAAEKKYKPATVAATPPAPVVPSIHAPGNGKPKSPSVGAQTAPVTTSAAGQIEQKNLAQEAVKQLFGK